MNAGPAPRPALVDAFAGVPVTVVGDACLDVWYVGGLRGLSREGAVPVVAVTDDTAAPGGAANTARALAALGADVRLVSAVGDDAAGEQLRGLLRGSDVDVDGVVTVPGRRTMTKRRLVARGQLLARFDAGDAAEPPPEVRDALVAAVADAVPGSAAVLAADYAAGLHGAAMRTAVAATARSAGAMLAVDAHDVLRWAGAAADLVTPDAEEVAATLDAEAAAEFHADRVGFVRRHGERLRRRSGARTLVATLDGDGAVVVRSGAVAEHVPVRPLDGTAGIGAGDTFVAAATLAMVAGADEVLAARVGCAAAGVSVRRPGTPVCTADDLREALLPSVAGPARPGSPRAATTAELAAEVAEHRRAGRRVVFTNGCFDVLHAGHIEYLQRARECGDVLIVGINSDASVRRLKGPDRPVNAAADRVAVLSGLSAVDRIAVFEDDTPVDLIRLLRPDVYVKGGDYTEGMLPEAPVVRQLGGEVRIVGYVADRSTTAVIERMRSGRGVG